MSEPRIVLYATRDCPHCAAVRGMLRAAGEAFEERDPTSSAVLLRELLAFSAVAIVPTVVVGGRALIGFDEVRLAEMLREPPVDTTEVDDYTDEELNGPDDDFLLSE